MRFGYGVGDYGKSDSWDEMLMKYKNPLYYRGKMNVLFRS